MLSILNFEAEKFNAATINDFDPKTLNSTTNLIMMLKF